MQQIQQPVSLRRLVICAACIALGVAAAIGIGIALQPAQTRVYTVKEINEAYTPEMKGRTVRVRGTVFGVETDPKSGGAIIDLYDPETPHLHICNREGIPGTVARGGVVTLAGEVVDSLDLPPWNPSECRVKLILLRGATLER